MSLKNKKVNLSDELTYNFSSSSGIHVYDPSDNITTTTSTDSIRIDLGNIPENWHTVTSTGNSPYKSASYSWNDMFNNVNSSEMEIFAKVFPIVPYEYVNESFNLYESIGNIKTTVETSLNLTFTGFLLKIEEQLLGLTYG